MAERDAASFVRIGRFSIVPSFFNVPAAALKSPLSLHDALPISSLNALAASCGVTGCLTPRLRRRPDAVRSEEHSPELQSHVNLVWLLLLEQKTIDVYAGARPTLCAFARVAQRALIDNQVVAHLI